jgi:hypothetical protein
VHRHQTCIFESTRITKGQNDEVYILRSIIISCHLQSSKCKLLINHLCISERFLRRDAPLLYEIVNVKDDP